MGALGLTKEGKRVDAASFTLLRPAASEDVAHAASRLGQWLGLGEIQQHSLLTKMNKAEPNSSWEKKTFDFVLDSSYQPIHTIDVPTNNA